MAIYHCVVICSALELGLLGAKLRYICETAKGKRKKMKEPIKIRLKPLADGNKSIYLDIYWKGVRKYEYLKLYIVPEINPLCKEQNKEYDGTYLGTMGTGTLVHSFGSMCLSPDPY